MSEDLYGKKIFPKNEGFGLTSQMRREALTLEPLNPRILFFNQSGEEPI